MNEDLKQAMAELKATQDRCEQELACWATLQADFTEWQRAGRDLASATADAADRMKAAIDRCEEVHRTLQEQFVDGPDDADWWKSGSDGADEF